MKDKLFKRRPHINWFQVFKDVSDDKAYGYFYDHLKKAKISNNKKAYLSLLHVFGKTKINQYRYSKDIRIFWIDRKLESELFEYLGESPWLV